MGDVGRNREVNLSNNLLIAKNLKCPFRLMTIAVRAL